MIAYQVVGDGPIDLVLLSSGASNVDVQWEYPPRAKLLERFATYSRVIMFDRRGTGQSDPAPPEIVDDLENWNEDLTAVLDAVGCQHAALIGEVDGGPWAMFFGATYPERTRALVLWTSYARTVADMDYPAGLTPEAVNAMNDMMLRYWGTEEMARMAQPLAEEADLPILAKLMRSSLTPAAMVKRMDRTRSVDVRNILPTIQSPTLVLHRTENGFVPLELGRYLAEHIPGARLIEVPGPNIQLYADEPDWVHDLIQEFITGVPPAPSTDRVLATVLFTDIVASTAHLASLGDRRWRDRLDVHDSTARHIVDQFGGTFVKNTGDGVLATFDGPGKAIRCAAALRRMLKQSGIDIRSGLHTGEVELRAAGDVGGIAVHIGARVMAEAGSGQVLCSRTVKDLVVGAGFVFEDLGMRTFKGVPDEWQIFELKAD